MPELRQFDTEEARRLAAENYSKGAAIYRAGEVKSTWRTPTALHAEVKGSAARPYEVSAGPRDDGSFWARCTCPAARRQSVCKHAAALLVAWATAPAKFDLRAEPEAPESVGAGLKVDSAAKRSRQPKADRRSLIVQGLDQAEGLLVDLCTQGLLAVTAEQVTTIAALAEAVETHKLRRLARQIVEIRGAVEAARSGAVDERAWAALLAEAWSTLQATRRALEKSGEPEQAALLEELIGKTWLEKDLRRVSGLRLLELAYESVVLSSGYRVETSYLIDVAAGAGASGIFAEKQITPVRLKDAPAKRSYSTALEVTAAGAYPGYPPTRLKLIEYAESPDAPDALWDRAIELAETSAVALRQRHLQGTLSPVAPQETFCLYRPAVVIAGASGLYLADGEGKSLAVDPARQRGLAGLRGALRRGPLGAVFGRLRFGDGGLALEPLGAVLERGSPRLVRLTA